MTGVNIMESFHAANRSNPCRPEGRTDDFETGEVCCAAVCHEVAKCKDFDSQSRRIESVL